MKPLILEPTFIDRAGRTVYNVYEDDPECRILRKGQFLGQMRWNKEAEDAAQFESAMEQQELL